MNKGTKIDIGGTIKDNTTAAVEHTIGMIVLISIVCCLFAPWFAFLFEDHYCEVYNMNKNPCDYHLVQKAMKKTKIVLWIVAIISWIIVLGVYASYGHNNI